MSGLIASSITVVRCGGMAAHWEGVIARCERGEAEVLKEEGGNRVLALSGEQGKRAAGTSAGLVIKRWELRTIGARVKSALKMSRAWRHWAGAERLTKAGVRTATCYAVARSEKDGVAVEWLVMERLAGKSLLRHMADGRGGGGDLTVKQEHALARAVMREVLRLVAGKVFNRDGKPSNWVVAWPRPDAPALAVIDCVGLRTGAWNGEGDLEQMVANLVIEPLGCGCLPRRSLLMRALLEGLKPDRGDRTRHRADRRRAWQAIVEAVKAHGDPTPKVDPLK